MSKTVIISGGMLDEGFTEKVLEANPEAYIIAVDKGLEYLYNHKIEPQYIVGDFETDFSFPGIGLELKMIVSFGWIVTFRCTSAAMRDNAAIDSP